MVEKNQSLAQRLDSYDRLLLAYRSGSGKPRMGSPRLAHVRPPCV